MWRQCDNLRRHCRSRILKHSSTKFDDDLRGNSTHTAVRHCVDPSPLLPDPFLPTRSYQISKEEIGTSFALYLGKALTRLRERTPPLALTPAPTQGDHLPPSMNMHGQRREGNMGRLPDVIPGHPRLVDSLGKAFNACPDCAFEGCPKANSLTKLNDTFVQIWT